MKLDDNKYDLENIIITSFGKNVIDALKGYYVVDDQYSSNLFIPLIRFRKLNKVDQNIGNYDFPRYLFWKKDFSNTEEKQK